MAYHIKNLIAGFFQDLAHTHRKTQNLLALIGDNCDASTRIHIRSARIKDATLLINVDAAVWAYQVHLFQPKILEHIKKVFPDVRQISVQVRGS